MTAAAPAGINPKALTTTVVVHVLLLVLFGLWSYTIPVIEPQPQEMGMEVNLGTSDNGFGTSQPQDPEEPAESASRSNTKAASASLSANMIQDDDEESPPVATSNSPRSTNIANNTTTQHGTTATASTAPATHTQQQRPKFVMSGGQGRGGNGAMTAVPGGAEGNTFGNGDRGIVHGTPGAANYTGTPGHGTGGIAFSMNGRNIVAYPAKEAEFREGGRVVVGVTVNRSGAIVGAHVKSSSNSELNRLALQKIQSVRFNKSDDAPPEQFGTITFMFKTRQ